MDTLFRTASGAEPKAAAGGVREETSHILAEGLARGEVSTADRSYLAQLVAAQTGVSDADAQRRVDDVINQLRADADAARRASEMAAIFVALSMLVGAFIGKTHSPSASAPVYDPPVREAPLLGRVALAPCPLSR